MTNVDDDVKNDDDNDDGHQPFEMWCLFFDQHVASMWSLASYVGGLLDINY